MKLIPPMVCDYILYYYIVYRCKPLTTATLADMAAAMWKEFLDVTNANRDVCRRPLRPNMKSAEIKCILRNSYDMTFGYKRQIE